MLNATSRRRALTRLLTTWTVDARTVHYGVVDLHDVMRTTAAVREFTDDPLPDDVLERILDNARFAPSGGNRQGARVVVIRDRATREALAELSIPGVRRYV